MRLVFEVFFFLGNTWIISSLGSVASDSSETLCSMRLIQRLLSFRSMRLVSMPATSPARKEHTKPICTAK